MTLYSLYKRYQKKYEFLEADVVEIDDIDRVPLNSKVEAEYVLFETATQDNKEN